MTKGWIQAPLLALFAAIILAGCSREPADDSIDANRIQARTLFAAGFTEADDMPGARYARDPAIRQEISEQLASILPHVFSQDFMIDNPEEFLRSGAAGELVDGKLKALGLPPDSIASASILFFGTAWELANLQPITGDRQTGLLHETRKQLDPNKFAAQGAPGKQREAEMRLQIAALWLAEARLRQGSAEQMRELSDAVQQDMKRLSGNDMRLLDLSETGFVDR